MGRSHVDGFQLFGGVLAIATAPLMLAAGEPAGWSFLLLASGIVVLGAFAAIIYGIDYDIKGPLHLLEFGIGILCVTIAVIYLTRAANDLPTLFPGHGNSENFRVLPGILALAAGSVVLARAVASAHPRRSHSSGAS